MSVEPILNVHFFLTSLGGKPVRDWLKSLDKDDRKMIGEDIKLVQFRWPLGMPLVRKIEAELWEIRNGNIARVFFTVKGCQMILLHGFIKKSQKIPQKEIDLARTRKHQWAIELCYDYESTYG